ncbi:MAG TPA: glycosyltransferase family A protein, partial [Actinomycetota bacterium]|nr:glycosyltransferase family A protein [Actinomycetota bacterium]
MPAASVVVLCRNDHGTLGRVLEGLLGQRTEEPFEVVLVDSSDDGGGAALATLGTWAFELEVVTSPVGLTTGAARNAGMARARGRYLLFLAADCIPDPDWVGRRVGWHRAGHPVVAGAVTCATPRTLAARVQWLSRFSGALPSGGPRRRTLPQFAWSYDREIL